MDITIKRHHVIVASVFVILTASAVTYWVTRPRPTPWLDYPTDGQAVVTQFMRLIHEDTVPAHNQAYRLVNLPDRRADDDGHLQVYHNCNMYLTMLFTRGWIDHMTVVAKDPGRLYEVHVGTETLHIELVPQRTPEGTVTNHLGILDVQEFSLEGAAQASQMAAITAFLGGVAGRGAQDNLQGVLTAGGSYGRYSAAQRKQIVIPAVLNTNNPDLRRTMLHLWPVRGDPTVVAILTSIQDDQRYAPDVQKTARLILAGSDELSSELIAIGESDQ